MYQRLLRLNAEVGKTTLDELYAMTPREYRTMVAGGMQKQLNRELDEKWALTSTVVPSVLIDANKFDQDQVIQEIEKRQQNIDAITDEKVQKKLVDKKKQEKRFINLFNLGHRKGG